MILGFRLDDAKRRTLRISQHRHSHFADAHGGKIFFATHLFRFNSGSIGVMGFEEYQPMRRRAGVAKCPGCFTWAAMPYDKRVRPLKEA